MNAQKKFFFFFFFPDSLQFVFSILLPNDMFFSHFSSSSFLSFTPEHAACPNLSSRPYQMCSAEVLGTEYLLTFFPPIFFPSVGHKCCSVLGASQSPVYAHICILLPTKNLLMSKAMQGVYAQFPKEDNVHYASRAHCSFSVWRSS